MERGFTGLLISRHGWIYIFEKTASNWIYGYLTID